MATSHNLDALITPVGQGLFLRYRATAHDGDTLVVALERNSFGAAKRALNRLMRLYIKRNIRSILISVG